MAQILIRNLEESVKKAIAARAARHGQSMEEEARDILRMAATKPLPKEIPIGTRFRMAFEKIGLDEELPDVMRGMQMKIPKF